MQTEAIFECIADRISVELEKAQSSIYITVAWFTNKKPFNGMQQRAQ